MMGTLTGNRQFNAKNNGIRGIILLHIRLSGHQRVALLAAMGTERTKLSVSHQVTAGLCRGHGLILGGGAAARISGF